MVNVAGTVIAFVKAVGGRVVVAKTMPGRIPPTTEPMPGKLSAGPNVPLLGCGLTAKVALKPGQPNSVPKAPGAWPNVPADPPTKGNCTKGWLNAGRKTAVPAALPAHAPKVGASTIAGPLPRNGNFSCEFGR